MVNQRDPAVSPKQKERYSRYRDAPLVWTGTNYPCHQEDLDSLQHLSSRRPRNTAPPEEAIRELVKLNCPRRHCFLRAELDAEKRLQEMVFYTRKDFWLPDVAFKMFADLDIVFFGGCLLHYVELCWEPQREFIRKGHQLALAVTSPTDPGHALIQLSADGNLHYTEDGRDRSFEEMWETLLHEMIVGAQCCSRRCCEEY